MEQLFFILPHMQYVITAGGAGNKLWPLSTPSFPKQFITEILGESLFQMGIAELLKRTSAKNIWVSTKSRYVEICRKQAPELPLSQYIIEPDITLNRGPAEGLIHAYFGAHHPGEVLTWVQVDNIRDTWDQYWGMTVLMEELVKDGAQYITGAVGTKDLVGGVDYIITSPKAFKEDERGDTYKIEAYIDRSEVELRRDEYDKEQFSLHSNHLTTTPEAFFKAYESHHENWFKGISEMRDILAKDKGMDVWEKIAPVYSKMEKGPTEIVTQELMNNGEMFAVELPYSWYDFGTWKSVHDYFKAVGLSTTIGAFEADGIDNSLLINTTKEEVTVSGLKDSVSIKSPNGVWESSLDESGRAGEMGSKSE